MSTVSRGRPSYPWDKWFSSHKELRLIRGKHFHCQPHSMVAQIRKVAAKLGHKVSLNVYENTIIMKVGA